MPEVLPELRDVVVRVDAIPRTQLVHVDVGRFGLVLTRAEAVRLGRELLAASGHRPLRGHAAAAGGRAAPGRSAARAR